MYIDIGGLHMHDVHQKHDYAHNGQFAPNFDMSWRTIQCVCSKFEVVWTTELQAKEVGEFSIRLP